MSLGPTSGEAQASGVIEVGLRNGSLRLVRRALVALGRLSACRSPKRSTAVSGHLWPFPPCALQGSYRL